MVQGDIIAPERVQLFSTSIVLGDIITRRIEIAEQVVFHGHCVALRDDAEFSAARQDRLTVKAISAREAETLP
jgi:cytoskeletal protein CcmA (bactofilin family)